LARRFFDLGLTLTYSKGRLTSMTAASNIESLKARYDAAGAGKDQFVENGALK
jgi:hypothetical protein